jgi:hypothetical protein
MPESEKKDKISVQDAIMDAKVQTQKLSTNTMKKSELDYTLDLTPSRQAILNPYGYGATSTPSGIDLASSNRKIRMDNEEIERKFAECEKGTSPFGKNLQVTCVIR